MTTMVNTKRLVLGSFTALGLFLYIVLALFTDLSIARIIAVVFIVGFFIPQILVRAMGLNVDS